MNFVDLFRVWFNMGRAGFGTPDQGCMSDYQRDLHHSRGCSFCESMRVCYTSGRDASEPQTIEHETPAPEPEEIIVPAPVGYVADESKRSDKGFLIRTVGQTSSAQEVNDA